MLTCVCTNVLCPQGHNARYITTTYASYGLGQFIVLLGETKVVNMCSFKAILIFCVIYVAGMITCTVAAYPDWWVGWTQPFFYIGRNPSD